MALLAKDVKQDSRVQVIHAETTEFALLLVLVIDATVQLVLLELTVKQEIRANQTRVKITVSVYRTATVLLVDAKQDLLVKDVIYVTHVAPIHALIMVIAYHKETVLFALVPPGLLD